MLKEKCDICGSKKSVEVVSRDTLCVDCIKLTSILDNTFKYYDQLDFIRNSAIDYKGLSWYKNARDKINVKIMEYFATKKAKRKGKTLKEVEAKENKYDGIVAEVEKW